MKPSRCSFQRILLHTVLYILSLPGGICMYLVWVDEGSWWLFVPKKEAVGPQAAVVLQHWVGWSCHKAGFLLKLLYKKLCVCPAPSRWYQEYVHGFVS